MLGGRFLRFAILIVLLASPLAGAATPSPDRQTADAAGGQEITGMAADPSGQFVAAVVAVDAGSLTGPGGTLPLPGTGTGGSLPDVYMCDYGPATAPTSGGGCISGSHSSSLSPTPGAPQRVDATVVPGANGGNQGIFAVAGPGAAVSKWQQTSSTAQWTDSLQSSGMSAVNVSISPDGKRVAFAAAATSPTTPGRIEVWGHNTSVNREDYLWHVQLTAPDGSAVRPTTLDWSRTGNVLVIGTSGGVLLMDPSGNLLTGPLEGMTQPGSVSSVQASRDGAHVVVGGANGVFLFSTTRASGRVAVLANSNFSRPLGEPVQEVAFALDGKLFAAGAGTKVHFFERTNDFSLARSRGDAYDVGARVSDMAYDETGDLLVVVAGNKVFGFGPYKNTPIWQFDATTSAFGALDGPLRHVSVSDDGQRILVAGRTKTMPYSSTIAVAATLSSTGSTSFQPTQVIPLTLSIRNAGSLTDNYTFVVESPGSEWLVSDVTGIQLDPDQPGTIQFNMTVPAGITDGAYGVKVRVRSETEFELSQRRGTPTAYIAEPSFNFTIPRSVVLKVEAPDDLVDVEQGAPETIAFLVRNEGNAEAVVNLSLSQSITSGPSWEHRFEPSEQVRIGAGSVEEVRLILTAPQDVAKGGENVVTIRAREGSVEATDTLTASVEAEFGTQLATNQSQWEFFPGQTHSIRINVTNVGNIEATYNLTHELTPVANANDWRVSFGTNQIPNLEAGDTEYVIVTVKAVASTARDATLTIRTHSDKDPTRTPSAPLALALVVVERPPEDDDDGGNLLPGPSALILLVGVGALALARRHRGGRRE